MRKLTGMRMGLAALGCLLLASCGTTTGGGGAVRQYTKGQELAFYDFSEPHTFEEGAYGPATLRVADGYYQIDVHQGDNQLWWGQWGDTYGDVVIDVDVNQITERSENAYGVMCRVRGTVGQPQTPDPTLLAIMNATPETTETAEAAAQETEATTTAEATAAATAQETESQTTAQATAQVTALTTAEATVESAETAAATSESTETAEAAASQETTPQATAQTTESAAVEVAATATEAVTEAATEVVTEAATPAQTARPSSTPPPTATSEPVYTEGDGYMFLIQGSGSFAILRAKGRDITPLINWTPSDKIHVGPGENHLRAVCLGDYLAFYINDSFVGDATDATYSEGQVGLLASAANRLGVEVNFDNLTVSEAKPG